MPRRSKFFARRTTCKTVVSKSLFLGCSAWGMSTPAEPPHQRLPNGTREASGGASQRSHSVAVGTGTTLWRQVQVTALIGHMLGWCPLVSRPFRDVSAKASLALAAGKPRTGL
jgi:hypothetical protein